MFWFCLPPSSTWAHLGRVWMSPHLFWTLITHLGWGTTADHSGICCTLKGFFNFSSIDCFCFLLTKVNMHLCVDFMYLIFGSCQVWTEASFIVSVRGVMSGELSSYWPQPAAAPLIPDMRTEEGPDYLDLITFVTCLSSDLSHSSLSSQHRTVWCW